MKTTCAHCNQQYDIGAEHECNPECLHCGVTFDNLENPEYDSPKIAISRHQRTCEDRPESWDRSMYDPEADWRERRRERKRIRQWERKMQKERHVW